MGREREKGRQTGGREGEGRVQGSREKNHAVTPTPSKLKNFV